MDPALNRALSDAASWSVSYGAEVYSDARKLNEVWYFLDANNGFVPFATQSAVVPICTNRNLPGDRA